MTWNDDQHGKVFASREIKLYKDGGHTWAMKLSQLPRQTGLVRIITHSLPTLDYVLAQLGRRPAGVYLVCHTNFRAQAEVIKQRLPDLRIAVHPTCHSKVLLIEPATIYVGSANFGVSGWHETTVGIRSTEVHDWYVQESFSPLWAQSEEIGGPPA